MEKLQCPKCKSKNLQYVSLNSTDVTSTGGGYGAGKGCLGYLLLGPLGLLCGACGSKQKITTTNTQTSHWVCKDCGNKFRSLEDIRKEIDDEKENMRERGKRANIVPLIVSVPFLFAFLFAGLNFVLSVFLTLLFYITLLIIIKAVGSNLDKESEGRLFALYSEERKIKENAYYKE